MYLFKPCPSTTLFPAVFLTHSRYVCSLRVWHSTQHYSAVCIQKYYVQHLKLTIHCPSILGYTIFPVNAILMLYYTVYILSSHHILQIIIILSMHHARLGLLRPTTKRPIDHISIVEPATSTYILSRIYAVVYRSRRYFVRLIMTVTRSYNIIYKYIKNYNYIKRVPEYI